VADKYDCSMFLLSRSVVLALHCVGDASSYIVSYFCKILHELVASIGEGAEPTVDARQSIEAGDYDPNGG
jgi:hypothetical protein